MAVLVNDITARKHAEEALRSSEERQAFLLQFSDTLRPLADPGDIQTQAARLLGEHLHLDRCGYADTLADGESVQLNFSYLAAGVLPFAATHRLADYGPALLAALQRGETLAIDTLANYPAATDPATAAAYQAAEVGAFVAVPLLRHRQLRAVLFAHQRAPRHWAPAEIALIEQVADRTWTAAECAQSDADRRASEATLAAVFEALPVAVGLLNAHGQLTLANRQMHYYLPTGLMPSLDDTQHPRWRAYTCDGGPLPPSEFPGARARRGEQGGPGVEMFYSPPEGPEVWTQVIAWPLPGENGHVTVVINIDAQKRITEALRQSEEHFRLFLTASSDTIYRMSPDWRQMLTLSGQHFLADTIGPSTTWVDKYIPPQDQALAWATIHAAIAGKHPFELEHRVFRADGSVAWTASRAVPVLDAQGEITEWFGAATDITARKASQEALRLSEARLSLALQAGRMGSFEWG